MKECPYWKEHKLFKCPDFLIEPHWQIFPDGEKYSDCIFRCQVPLDKVGGFFQGRPDMGFCRQDEEILMEEKASI